MSWDAALQEKLTLAGPGCCQPGDDLEGRSLEELLFLEFMKSVDMRDS